MFSKYSPWIFSHTAFCSLLILFFYWIPSSSHQPNPSKMGLISFPTNVFCRRPLSISPPLRTKSSCSYNPWLNLKSILKRQPQRAQVFNDPLLSLSNQAVVQRGLSLRRKRLPPVVSCSSESTGPREEDNRALEAVQKLYTAIKNKNVKEVSDVIGDECRCFCNFISASQPFHGKKVGDQFQRIITHDFFSSSSSFSLYQLVYMKWDWD